MFPPTASLRRGPSSRDFTVLVTETSSGQQISYFEARSFSSSALYPDPYYAVSPVRVILPQLQIPAVIFSPETPDRNVEVPFPSPDAFLVSSQFLELPSSVITHLTSSPSVPLRNNPPDSPGGIIFFFVTSTTYEVSKSLGIEPYRRISLGLPLLVPCQTSIFFYDVSL